MQQIDPLAVGAGHDVRSELLDWHWGLLAFAVGQHVEACQLHLLEQLGTPASPVENHGDPPLEPHQLADLGQQLPQGRDQGRVGLLRDEEHRRAIGVVDPDVLGGRQRDAHPGYVRLGQAHLARVHPDVAVHIEEAQRFAAGAYAELDESLQEGLRRPFVHHAL